MEETNTSGSESTEGSTGNRFDRAKEFVGDKYAQASGAVKSHLAGVLLRRVARQLNEARS